MYTAGSHQDGETMENLFMTLVDTGDFRKLVEVVRAAGMEDMLSEQGPFTLFAPTDEAFQRFPPGQWEELRSDGERAERFLREHLVEELVRTADLRKMRAVTALSGDRLPLDVTNRIRVGRAVITEPDIRCSNGTIQGVGEVLMTEMRLLA